MAGSLGIFLQLSPDIPLQSIFQSSTRQAEEINKVTNYFFITAGAILLIVAAVTAYILYAFRARKNAGVKEKSIRTHWEIVMIGIPVVLVCVFLYFNIKTMRNIQPPANDTIPDVTITGHQWWWEIRYTDGNINAANEIHLPVNKTVLLKLCAADVIHDWWVPSFGSKMDMVPSQDNYLWVTITKPGNYYGICSEFCGQQHAHMRIKVVAENLNDYQTWLKKNLQLASNDPAYAQGRQLFSEKTCGSCHRVAGTPADGRAGPDLSHLASRSTLLAGLLVNNPENLESWIRHPQQIKPGASMPDFLLPDSSLKSIVHYLTSLK